MERADDVETTMAKLKNDVENLNNERFHSVLELKVCFSCYRKVITNVWHGNVFRYLESSFF